jgi:dihydroxyacid dehydratase/phosphogluconate dehydratase
VPFWMRFNMGTDYVELEHYLSTSEQYDHIHVNLFSQGLWSPGVVPMERWQRLVESAADKVGEIIGVDTNAYPLDDGRSMRFQRAFQSLPPRHPVFPPLMVDDIEVFVDGHTAEYGRLWR